MDSKEAVNILEDDLMHIYSMVDRTNIMLQEVLDGQYYTNAPIGEALRSALKSASIKVEVAREAAGDVLATLDHLFSD